MVAYCTLPIVNKKRVPSVQDIFSLLVDANVSGSSSDDALSPVMNGGVYKPTMT